MELNITSNIDQFIGKTEQVESKLTGGWLPFLEESQAEVTNFYKSVSPVVSGLFRSEIKPGFVNEQGFSVFLDADAVNDTSDSGYRRQEGVNYGWRVLLDPEWSALGYDIFGRDDNVSVAQDMVDTRVSEYINSCFSSLK